MQTSFLAPADATLLAELIRLCVLIGELAARYGRGASAARGAADTQRQMEVFIRTPRDSAKLLIAEMQGLT